MLRPLFGDMAFQRDFGTCCLVVPRKFGVGLIAMAVFANAVICCIALFTNDIRFQAHGYSPGFYKLPTVVGVLGIVMGFVGLLGVYDDRFRWVKWFNIYFAFLVACKVAACIADWNVLMECEAYQGSSSGPLQINPNGFSAEAAIQALADAGLCSPARISYGIGCIIDLFIFTACLYNSSVYQYYLYFQPPYLIDFDINHDAKDRWNAYKVDAPSKRPYVPETESVFDAKSQSYGAVGKERSTTAMRPEVYASAIMQSTAAQQARLSQDVELGGGGAQAMLTRPQQRAEGGSTFGPNGFPI